MDSIQNNSMRDERQIRLTSKVYLIIKLRSRGEEMKNRSNQKNVLNFFPNPSVVHLFQPLHQPVTPLLKEIKSDSTSHASYSHCHEQFSTKPVEMMKNF